MATPRPPRASDVVHEAHAQDQLTDPALRARVDQWLFDHGGPSRFQPAAFSAAAPMVELAHVSVPAVSNKRASILSRVRHAFTANHPTEPVDKTILRAWFARIEAYRAEVKESWTMADLELDQTLITRTRRAGKSGPVVPAVAASRRAVRTDGDVWGRLATSALKHTRSPHRLRAAAGALASPPLASRGRAVVPPLRVAPQADALVLSAATGPPVPQRPSTARPISETCRFPRF